MRKDILILCGLMLAFNSCYQNADNDRNSILAILETQRQVWNKGNLEAYMQGYWKSDSLVFIGKSGPKYGWTSTLNNYRKGYPDKAAMGTLTFEIKEVRIISVDHAFVIGGWRLKRKEDEPFGSFTLLLKKIDGAWKIIADHSS